MHVGMAKIIQTLGTCNVAPVHRATRELCTPHSCNAPRVKLQRAQTPVATWNIVATCTDPLQPEPSAVATRRAQSCNAQHSPLQRATAVATGTPSEEALRAQRATLAVATCTTRRCTVQHSPLQRAALAVATGTPSDEALRALDPTNDSKGVLGRCGRVHARERAHAHTPVCGHAHIRTYAHARECERMSTFSGGRMIVRKTWSTLLKSTALTAAHIELLDRALQHVATRHVATVATCCNMLQRAATLHRSGGGARSHATQHATLRRLCNGRSCTMYIMLCNGHSCTTLCASRAVCTRVSRRAGPSHYY
jgi:hypothetical protein